MLPNQWRLHIDTAVATLALFVALYYRIPRTKRDAFEKANPRIAALIGMVAALVPFLPMFAAHARHLLAPNETTTPLVSTDRETPQPPWHESGSNRESGDAVQPSRDDPSP